MRSKLKFLIQFVIFIFSAVVFIWFIRDFDYQLLSELTLGLWVILIGIRVIAIIVYQYGSIYFFKSFGENVKFFTVSLINFSTTVSNYSTPVKIGFPIQVFLMKKMLNINYTKSTTMVFTNLLLMYFLAILLGSIGLLYLTNILIPFENPSKVGLTFLCLSGIASVLLFSLRKVISRLTIVRKISEKLKEGWNYIKNIKLSGMFLASFFFLFSMFLGTWIQYTVIRYMDMGASISLIALFLIQGIPFLLGSLSMIPLGLGVKDASLVFIITSIGASSTAAVAAALISRIVTLGFNIPLGLLAVNYLTAKGLINKQKEEETIYE